MHREIMLKCHRFNRQYLHIPVALNIFRLSSSSECIDRLSVPMSVTFRFIIIIIINFIDTKYRLSQQ